MEYKKDKQKFIQKKNSIYRHWPDRFHMFLSLLITLGSQLNMYYPFSDRHYDVLLNGSTYITILLGVCIGE